MMGGWDTCPVHEGAQMETPANAPVVRSSGLSKRYGDVIALRSLDLEVPRNSIFGFLGPNGSGKTTAMRLLLGLVRPTGGSATVLGLDIVRDSVAIRRRVGYLPQHPRFYDDLSPRQTLRYARSFFPRDPEQTVGSQIDEVLELVGLSSKRDQPVGGLSGGQRQRLGIAQAQIHRPELLILDEPASALDPIGRRDVLDIMRRLRTTTTVFYSTHILDDVQRVSDTVAILDAGEQVAQAPIEQLLGTAGISYDLAMRGDTEQARSRLLAQPWVEHVEVVPLNGSARLRVGVADERAAERELLRVVLADREVEVLRFAPTRTELEDVFVELVGAGAGAS
jgi:ABC-2 type transport system ATP-binding protein